jgi:hypothetical protein
VRNATGLPGGLCEGRRRVGDLHAGARRHGSRLPGYSRGAPPRALADSRLLIVPNNGEPLITRRARQVRIGRPRRLSRQRPASLARRPVLRWSGWWIRVQWVPCSVPLRSLEYCELVFCRECNRDHHKGLGVRGGESCHALFVRTKQDRGRGRKSLLASLRSLPANLLALESRSYDPR